MFILNLIKNVIIEIIRNWKWVEDNWNSNLFCKYFSFPWVPRKNTHFGDSGFDSSELEQMRQLQNQLNWNIQMDIE